MKRRSQQSHQHQHSSRWSGRQQTIISISPVSPARLACWIATAVSFWFVFFSRKSPSSGSKDGSSQFFAKQNKHRLAIVIPFVGESPDAIPAYFPLFCDAAAGSAGLVDFLIFHDGALGATHASRSFSCPDNVIFHSMENLEGLSRAFMKVVDRKAEASLVLGRDKLSGALSKVIQKYPYVLVEFKPALGHIFQDYLTGYSHWGYSDLDILFGDLERWITRDELEDFDIVTYGFGDQERIYLRGQFTFHRNDPHKINQLWRDCDYLSHMDKRFKSVLSGEGKLSLESAEGCYSDAVLKRTDLRVKYAVKAFTDVGHMAGSEAKDTVHTHGIYVGTGKRKDKTVIYKAGIDHQRGLMTLPHNWFERRGSIYSNSKELLYKPVGKRERIPLIQEENAKCMYWVKQKYQSRLCNADIESTDTVYWRNGVLYKEKYELATLPGAILTAPFFHFQEWKRYYRSAQLGGFHRNGPVTGYVLTKEGVLPMYEKHSKRNKVDKTSVASPLGNPLHQWHGVQSDNREQLPCRSYCLVSEPKQRPPRTNCRFQTSWQDANTVQILSGAPGWSTVDIQLEVTLALTLQLHADQLSDAGALQGFYELLTVYLNHWQGQPLVLVLHVAGSTPEFEAAIKAKLGQGSTLSTFGMDAVLVAAIFGESPDTVSRKALMNMAIDASPTRFVISGFELERGIGISRDTVFLSHRLAQVHRYSRGLVYFIPQFGITEGQHDFTMSSLESALTEGRLRSVIQADAGECISDTPDKKRNVGPEAFSLLENVWWKEVAHDKDVGQESTIGIQEESTTIQEIQSKLSILLSDDEQFNLYATDISPILLFDNLGPQPGMVTSDMVREVDEFGGKMCYNSMRLAQMATLGYSVRVLAGAFAASTPTLRNAIGDPSLGPMGVSRCDGCFFFTKTSEHEDILENISLEERQRPAKISILNEHSI